MYLWVRDKIRLIGKQRFIYNNNSLLLCEDSKKDIPDWPHDQRSTTLRKVLT